MNCKQLFFLSTIGAFLAASSPSDAAIFANSLVTSDFVTGFGSGDVTGPPDDGGLFLSDTPDPPANMGFIVVDFAVSLGDGEGDDILVIDIFHQVEETADVFVSTDGIDFIFAKNINSLDAGIDLNGIFSGPVNFLKVQNTSTEKAIDIDAIQGNFEYSESAQVPEPSNVLGMLAIVGIAGFIGSKAQKT